MSILDDAREGMDLDIRPQDDLFGHVNGRWLDDRGDPRRPVQLGTLRRAGRHRRGPGALDHRGARRASAHRRGRQRAREDRRALRLVHEHRRDRQARHPPGPAVGQRRGRAARRTRPGGLRRRVRAHRRARPVRVLRQHRPQGLRPLPGLPLPGRAGAARRDLLPRGQVRRDPREVRRLPRRALPAGRPRRRCRCRRRDRARDRHEDRRRALGARRDPRRAEDLQPADGSTTWRRWRRSSTGRPTSPTSAATTRRSPRPS